MELGDLKRAGRHLEQCWWRTITEFDRSHYRDHCKTKEVMVIMAKKGYFFTILVSASSHLSHLFKVAQQLLMPNMNL